MARALRHAAFPGAPAWDICALSTREQWLRVAALALSHAEIEVDKALRQAVAACHELGQHEAAKAVRKIRGGRSE